MRKYPIILLILIFSIAMCASQTNESSPQNADNGLVSYAFEHLEEYRAALSLAKMMRLRMSQLYPENAETAIAIVFPELMRYSEMRDSLEALATRLLYSKDKDNRIYSIGHFQMKPTFAETIEREIAKNSELKNRYRAIDYGGAKFTRKSRALRIHRLRNIDTEIAYISAFIDICTKKLITGLETPEERIKLLATAYNSGMDKTKQQLNRFMEQNSFPCGTMSKKSKWNYAQISADFFADVRPRAE